MVAYGFKRRFAPPILLGTKPQTIRARRVGRSRHARPGEQLQLYIGMRTRFCRKLGQAVCTAVEPVRLCFSRRGYAELIQIGDRYLVTAVEINGFARADGFSSIEDMAAFWWAEHPPAGGNVLVFEGEVIRWQPFSNPELLAELTVVGAA